MSLITVELASLLFLQLNYQCVNQKAGPPAKLCAGKHAEHFSGKHVTVPKNAIRPTHVIFMICNLRLHTCNYFDRTYTSPLHNINVIKNSNSSFSPGAILNYFFLGGALPPYRAMFVFLCVRIRKKLTKLCTALYSHTVIFMLILLCVILLVLVHIFPCPF